ncbi:hypothetical protein [Burkholderia vietnamiensis]|uniref:hypothetical protein n=1 Tax=Burkholderia vietnamiensis TaxID=60552 RepID=UPI001D14AE5C|nr:hypothetical protein [Burkholderia vietnamiensis]
MQNSALRVEGEGDVAYFSFRAECRHDVELFQAECVAAGIEARWELHPDGEGLPDVEVELESGASLDDLHAVVRRVADGHVMLQTLRPCRLAENSLSRNQGV